MMSLSLALLLAASAHTNPSQMKYTAGATGSSQRDVADKLSDVVSVKDFGVKGDGLVEAVTIQGALNALAGNGTLYFPLPTPRYNLGTVGLTIPAGSNIEIVCASGTVLSYSGTGTAITVGTSSADTGNFVLRGCGIDLGGAGVGANALKTVRVTGGKLENVTITGRVTAPDLGVGIIRDGTGNYAGNMEFSRVQVTGNYAKGYYCLGGSTINTCNADVFGQVVIARTTVRPGTGTIGFHWGANAGDGKLLGVDVEGYDTGIQVDGGFLHGFARIESNTLGLNFGATSFNNFIFGTTFANTTNVTYTGGQAFNSFVDTIGLQSNVNNGSTTSTVAYRDAADHGITISMQAGNTAEQQNTLRWLNKNSSIAWNLSKNIFSALVLDDGTNTRMVLNGGPNDDYDVRGTGTGVVDLNKSGGTGGVCFGSGAASCVGTVDSAGNAKFNGSKTRGTITLSAGTGTATVASGAICVCSDSTATTSVRCAVSSTTLTATGTGTDVIPYLCF